MTLVSQSRLRNAVLSCVLVVLGIVSFFHSCRPGRYGMHNRALSAQQILSHEQGTQHQRLNLNEHECRATFPGLFDEIDRSLARGPFAFSPSDPDYKGLVQPRMKNNALYILSTAPDTLPQILHQRTAILSQLHRALITSPSLLPCTTISFAINDVPKNNTWGFARPNKHAPHNNVWPMPLFTSWSWPAHALGPLDAVLDRIAALEHATGWPDKMDKLAWRGTPWFNPLGHPHLRKDLLRATRGKDWADVAALEESGTATTAPTNALRIEQFCGYKYIVYTEGVTYSARLAYHQACGSVLVMAPLTWVTVSAGLVRPILGQALLGRAVEKGSASTMMPGGLPTVERYEDANAVYVKPDFSDLEDVLVFLREHQHVAERIARNQREAVVEKGYLSMAAETCYWRALIRGWSKAAQIKDEEWHTWEGERYETWLLRETSMERHSARGRVAQGT